MSIVYNLKSATTLNGPTALHAVRQALGERHPPLNETVISPVVPGVVFIRLLHRRRAGVVTVPPRLDDVVPQLLRRVHLPEAGEGAVGPLVEAPRLVDGEVARVEGVEDGPDRLDGALEEGGVDDVGLVALGQEKPADVVESVRSDVAKAVTGPVKRAPRTFLRAPPRAPPPLSLY